MLHYLSDNTFDQAYLVTGRNPNDFWQHVLQMGNKPVNWRNQLLFNVVDTLKQHEIPIIGASTPYDHYFSVHLKGLALTDTQPFKINKACDAAEQFYMPFEKQIAHYPDHVINQSLITSLFSEMTGHEKYVAFPEGPSNESLIDALPTYLAMIGDTEKRGQFQFLLDRICAENEDALEIFFFDDKPDNIATAHSLMSENARISSFHTLLVDRVIGYEAPEIEAFEASTSSLHRR